MGTTEHDYTGEEASPADEVFAEFDRLCKQRDAALRRVSDAELELERAQAELKHVTQGLLPDLMERIGVAEILLPNGKRAILKESLHASLPKNDPERLRAGCDWLNENGYGKIIKWQVIGDLDKGEEKLARNAAKVLTGLGVRVKTAMGVHHSTLTALIRRLERDGRSVPDEVFGVHRKKEVAFK